MAASHEIAPLVCTLYGDERGLRVELSGVLLCVPCRIASVVLCAPGNPPLFLAACVYDEGAGWRFRIHPLSVLSHVLPSRAFAVDREARLRVLAGSRLRVIGDQGDVTEVE